VPFFWNKRMKPHWSDDGKSISGGTKGLTNTQHAIEGTDFGQDVGCIRALSATRFDQTSLLARDRAECQRGDILHCLQ